MTYQEQLARVKATLAAKRKAMGDVMTKAAKEDRTPNADENSQIEALEDEIKQLERNEQRLIGLIKSLNDAENLTPVAGENPEQAGASADGEKEPQNTGKNVTVTEQKLAPGIGFVQMAKAKALSAKLATQGSYVSAVEIAKSAGMHPKVVEELQKAVEVMSTTNAGVLVPTTPLTDEFVELLRADSIVDQLASKMRKGKFNSTIAGMATGATSQWVGEGEAKPVTNATYNSVTIKRHKVAGISVLTDELSRFNLYGNDQIVLNDLIESNRMLLDLTFIDDQPENDRRPAGSLNGATITDVSASDATTIKAALAGLRKQFISDNLSLSDAAYIMSETRANEWAELETPLGAPVFPGLQAPKGEKTINGIPVIESESAGTIVELVKASEFYLADEGQVEVAYSKDATITMPDGKLVHLFQENKEAIRAERFITWAKRRQKVAAALRFAA